MPPRRVGRGRPWLRALAALRQLLDERGLRVRCGGVLLLEGLLERVHAHQGQCSHRHRLRGRGGKTVRDQFRAAVRAVRPQRRLRQRLAPALPRTSTDADARVLSV